MTRASPGPSERRPARWWAALAVVLAAGCMPVGSAPAPRSRGEGPGHRQQELALPPQAELDVGRRAYAEALRNYRDRILPADAPEAIRCRRVARRLIRAVGIRPLRQEINLRTSG